METGLLITDQLSLPHMLQFAPAMDQELELLEVVVVVVVVVE
jgi:hypothetical protein